MLAIPKPLRTAGFVVVMVSLCTGIAKAGEKTEGETTNVRVVTQNDTLFIKTNAKTVKEFLEEEGIKLGELDTVNYDINDEIKANMRIIIKRAMPITVIIDENETRSFKTNELTLGRVLLNLKEKDLKEYRLCDGLDSSSPVEENMIFRIATVTESFHQESESIPFETVEVENNELEEGNTVVKTEGVNGIKITTYKDTYLSGRLESSEITDEQITPPVNRVIEIGTKVPEVRYEGHKVIKTLTMRTTGYTALSACYNKRPGDPDFGITAMGTQAVRGVVAVDPNVIPLGTKLFIEGYGFARAEDTGGAIKGNRLDLCFETNAEAYTHGVRDMVVHILED